MTDIDLRATILSVDGVGAFDYTSRTTMMESLHSLEKVPSFANFMVFHFTSLCEFMDLQSVAL